VPLVPAGPSRRLSIVTQGTLTTEKGHEKHRERERERERICAHDEVRERKRKRQRDKERACNARLSLSQASLQIF
jgi:hypothetical protein